VKSYIFVYKNGDLKTFVGQVYSEHLQMIGVELETIILPDLLMEYREGKW